MDVAITIVMLVPVLLAVALIINVIRKNVTECQAGDPVDISGVIPAVIVLMVAVLVIVAMGNAASPYVYDEESGELTIQKNVPQLDVQPWDSYASDVKSLIIEDNVTVATGAFDTMTNLEYVKIGEGSEISSGAFGVSFEDAFGNPVAVSDIDGYGYAGFGDGVLYQADPGIYAFTSDGIKITGFATGITGVLHIVLPEMNEGRTITAINSMAFNGNTTVVDLLASPGCEISQIGYRAFQGCTALESVRIPESALDIGYTNFSGCTSLASVELPAGLKAIPDALFDGCTSLETIEIPSGVEEIKYHSFNGCTSLASVELPSGLRILGNGAFAGCSSITSMNLPAGLTNVSGYVFVSCTGVTEVTFEEGFSPTLNQHWADNWRFYASDGTTVLDKTVPANLAGKTFMGTASALIEVSPGQLSLTPDQIQQVRLHDAELQDLKDRLDIDPLPFQPSLQTEQEQVAA